MYPDCPSKWQQQSVGPFSLSTARVSYQTFVSSQTIKRVLVQIIDDTVTGTSSKVHEMTINTHTQNAPTHSNAHAQTKIGDRARTRTRQKIGSRAATAERMTAISLRRVRRGDRGMGAGGRQQDRTGQDRHRISAKSGSWWVSGEAVVRLGRDWG